MKDLLKIAFMACFIMSIVACEVPVETEGENVTYFIQHGFTNKPECPTGMGSCATPLIYAESYEVGLVMIEEDYPDHSLVSASIAGESSLELEFLVMGKEFDHLELEGIEIPCGRTELPKECGEDLGMNADGFATIMVGAGKYKTFDKPNSLLFTGKAIVDADW